MSEHVILVAFDIEALDRENAHLLLQLALKYNMGGVEPIQAWWVAEDDRHDGSDNDSAVFVNPGQAADASLILQLAGFTAPCNFVPQEQSREWGERRGRD